MHRYFMNYFDNLSLLVIEEKKIVKYLLNEAHPDGGSKARLFMNYGFHREKWQDFVQSIKNHAKVALLKSEVKTRFGTKNYHAR